MDDDNIINLHTKSTPHKPLSSDPDKSLIEMLEYLLDAAKEGKVSGICAGVVYNDGECAGMTAGLSNVSLIGTMELAKHMLIQNKDVD